MVSAQELHWEPPLYPVLTREMRPRGRAHLQHIGHLLAGFPDPEGGGFAGLPDPEDPDHHHHLGHLPHHKEHSGPLLTGLPDPGEEGPAGLPDPEDLGHLNGGALNQMDHWGPPLSPILMGEMRPRGRTQHSGHLLAGCPDPGEGGFAGLQDPEVLSPAQAHRRD